MKHANSLVMPGLDPGIHVLSSPGTRVWLRQPEHKLDEPGDPVTTALSLIATTGVNGFPLSRE
jgi:hypothetical protein